MLTFIGWLLIIVLFVVGMAGIIFPVLPGVIAIYAAFFVYGLFISFEPFGFWFWSIQTAILAVIFIADYWLSAKSVKKYGGSRASVIGTTIGLIIGPFLIPGFGLILGPLVGAIIGELTQHRDINRAVKVGWGSLVGLFTSSVMKIVLQLSMIILFFVWVIF
ncbi:DUF456 domain-containing protein [Longirhabdus pacifica]|uniref:DUF456 domain-containing protein n=1 Tax=Longirhabdus pacifica TaxID=2305227 RepID=UPI001008EAAD|nr:DUF456 domain-containing protein [Longirhabdus pacifica]